MTQQSEPQTAAKADEEAGRGQTGAFGEKQQATGGRALASACGRSLARSLAGCIHRAHTPLIDSLTHSLTHPVSTTLLPAAQREFSGQCGPHERIVWIERAPKP